MTDKLYQEYLERLTALHSQALYVIEEVIIMTDSDNGKALQQTGYITWLLSEFQTALNELKKITR